MGCGLSQGCAIRARDWGGGGGWPQGLWVVTRLCHQGLGLRLGLAIGVVGCSHSQANTEDARLDPCEWKRNGGSEVIVHQGYVILFVVP